jgi:hypothetical protein
MLSLCTNPDPIMANIHVSVIRTNMCTMERRISFLKLETVMKTHNSYFGLSMWKRMTWSYGVLSTTASSRMVVDDE